MDDNCGLMCKYFAHRFDCEKETLEGECDYSHNENVRTAYEIIKLNRNKEIPIEQTR